MALALDELLAALPAEADEAEPLPAAIEEIFEKLAHRPVPVGSLARLWTLGTLQAKIAAAYLAYWVRCGFLSSDDAARRLNDTHLAAAIKLLGGMSYLRGAIMKVGQVLANYPKLLPEHYAEALCRDVPAAEHARNAVRDAVDADVSRFPCDGLSFGVPRRCAAGDGRRAATAGMVSEGGNLSATTRPAASPTPRSPRLLPRRAGTRSGSSG